jgi:NCS2 family nucleobase:cation symporter-2
MSVAFVIPVIVVEAIGVAPSQASDLIAMAMLATGIGTILQGIHRGPVGSGYLCPLINGPAFLSASLMAGKAGGLPLIFGMTAVAGCCEALFSRFLVKMRAIFPAEVKGTIVMMVGIEIIPVAVQKFLGVDKAHPTADMMAVLVALITLAAMAGFNVWGAGNFALLGPPGADRRLRRGLFRRYHDRRGPPAHPPGAPVLSPRGGPLRTLVPYGLPGPFPRRCPLPRPSRRWGT